MILKTMDEELQERFEFRCRRCGSNDVHLDYEESRYISEETGWDPSTFSIGCNACKNNDYRT